MSPTKWKTALEKLLNTQIERIERVSGGDINLSFKISTRQQDYFLKVNQHSKALSMFKTEDKGLRLLRTISSINVPDPTRILDLKSGIYGLLMPYIETSSPKDEYWVNLAHQLGSLHQSSSSHFGLDHDNFIGWLPQSNQQFPSWGEFYAASRILPISKICRDKHYLNTLECQSLERLCLRFHEIFPEELPSLIHGDLWAGNVMCGLKDSVIFIDPAISYSHREMDIAMSQLFGGFSPIFLESYNERFPMIQGWKDRLQYGQLYYLLVHLALFGSSYHPSIVSIISKF